MPFIVTFQNFSSWPQSSIIPDATVNQAGVMTPAQVAALAALGAPGAFVLWSDLGFFDGFVAGSSPYGVPESRVVGDRVELAGLVVGPVGGIVNNGHITNLPVGQQPSVARVMTSSYQVGSADPVVCTIGVDDAAGTLTGTPGAVVFSSNLPGGGALVRLDGLSFVL